MDLATRITRRLTALSGTALFPSWSPDGKWIAFTLSAGDQLDLYLIHADGSGLEKIETGTQRNVWPRWSSDGSLLAYFARPEDNDELYTWDFHSNTATRITNKAGHDFCPAWSPEATRLAAASIDGDGSRYIRVFNLDGSAPVVVTSGHYRVTEPAWSSDGKRIAYAARVGEADTYDIYIRDVE
jgi:TolB protein